MSKNNAPTGGDAPSPLHPEPDLTGSRRGLRDHLLRASWLTASELSRGEDPELREVLSLCRRAVLLVENRTIVRGPE